MLFMAAGCDLLDNKSGFPTNENIWVNGYLASWMHNPETTYINSGVMKTSDIDWSALTHLTYFALRIGPDGTPAHSLDPADRNNFNTDRISAIVSAGHLHNTNVIFSVGGGGNYEEFREAIMQPNRGRFTATIHNFIHQFGFDGVNLNMLPIEPDDFSDYSLFVRDLSASFDSISTKRGNRPILTIAALKSQDVLSLYATIQDHLDQINILTYDMAQPWRGWQAWHNSALYNKNATFLNNPSLRLPYVDEKVDEAIAAGILREKIGICISFYGYVWDTVHLMEQWSGWPTQNMNILRSVSFSDVVSEFGSSETLWDKNARVPYINISEPRAFVTFDNELSVFNKTEYAKKKRIGGIMIWELGGGFLQEPEGTHRDPLLQSIKKSAFKNRSDH